MRTNRSDDSPDVSLVKSKTLDSPSKSRRRIDKDPEVESKCTHTRKSSSTRPVMKSLDLRTTELNECKFQMEEKQPMFNNLISIKRITLDRSRSRIRQQTPTRSSVEGSLNRDREIGASMKNLPHGDQAGSEVNLD